MSKTYTQQQWLIFITIGSVFINYFLAAGFFPLTDLDEGAYAGVTREMFVRGDWLSTYLNGEPWFEKPILMYWMQSIGVAIFGVNEWGFRLPSAVASSIWFYCIYRFVKQEINAEVGILAALVTATAIGTTFIYKAAIPDPFLTLFITVVLFDIYRYAQLSDTQKSPQKLIIRAFIFMGLGVLAKGPIAIIVPSAVAFFYFLSQGKFALLFKAILNPWGWLALILIVVPWHWYQYQLYGDLFVNDYFFKHNVGRFATSLDGHAGNLLYYIVAIFLLSFPFWRFIVKGLGVGFTSLRNRKVSPLHTFLIIWFLVVIGFFTFASTKLPHYLMYGMTPVFILCAEQIKSAQIKRWGLLCLGIVFSALIFSVPYFLESIATKQDEPFYRDALLNASDSVNAAFLVGLFALLLCFFIVAFLSIKPVVKLGLCGLLVSTQMSWLLMPTVINYQQQALKEAAFYSIENNISPVMWGMNMPSFSVYAQRVTPKRKPESGEWVITETNQLEKLGNVEIAYQKNGITLAKKP